MQGMREKKVYFTVILLSFYAMACNPKSSTPPQEESLPAIVSTLQAAIGQHPDSAVLYQQLVDTLVNLGAFRQAANWADSAWNRSGGKAASWLLLKADMLRQAKALDEAVAAYNDYLNAFPGNVDVVLNLASALAEKGDSAALRICTQISANTPYPEDKAAAWYIAGLYHNVAKQYLQAIPYFDKAIALQYSFTEAWLEKGYSLYDAGQTANAIAHFRQLATLQPRNADAWYWLAKSYEALPQKDSAIKYYTRVTRLDAGITEAVQALERLR